MGSWGEICTFDTHVDSDGNVTHGAMINIDLSERLLDERRCHISMWYFSPTVPLDRLYVCHHDEEQTVNIVAGDMTREELLKLRSDIDDTLRQMDARDTQEGAEHDGVGELARPDKAVD